MADERERIRRNLGLSPTPTVTPIPIVTPSPASTPLIIDPQDVRDPKTGLTPAQVAAQKAQQDALTAAAGARIPVTVTGVSTGNVGTIVTGPTTPPREGYEWASRSVAGGGVTWYERPIPGYWLGRSSGGGNNGGGNNGSGNDGGGNNNDELIKLLQSQIALLQQNKIDTAAQVEADKRARAENAITVLTDRFSRYGLASLVPKIRELAISGASEDTIALQLQETEEYKQRFSANQERLKKGLRVLDPGSYIGLEDRYRQILRAYGLKQFDTDSYVTQFLANDTSPEELSSRVVTAVQRVQNADPALVRTLKDFYGIGTTDMVAYVLDPTNQFPKIERQVAAAEIGTAARRQGLEAGVLVSEQLAAQGVTEAEARRGYATIADILPQAGKLSAIYTDVLDQYGQAEAEQEVFNSLASAQRKRRALTEREIASFAGQSGLGRTALGSITGGNI